MFQFIMQGGPVMLLLVILGITILLLTVKEAVRLLSGAKKSPGVPENGRGAIIFWGGVGMVLGFFGHFLGMYNAMQAIGRAGDISPAIVMQGYGVSLSTVLAGLFIFLFSAIVWFLLRWGNSRQTSAA